MWYENVGRTFVLSQSTRLTDGRKKGQTKRRTNRRLSRGYTVRYIICSRIIQAKTSSIWMQNVRFKTHVLHWSSTTYFISSGWPCRQTRYRSYQTRSKLRSLTSDKRPKFVPSSVATAAHMRLFVSCAAIATRQTTQSAAASKNSHEKDAR